MKGQSMKRLFLMATLVVAMMSLSVLTPGQVPVFPQETDLPGCQIVGCDTIIGPGVCYEVVYYSCSGGGQTVNIYPV